MSHARHSRQTVGAMSYSPIPPPADQLNTLDRALPGTGAQTAASALGKHLTKTHTPSVRARSVARREPP